jgi:hypothetical protein
MEHTANAARFSLQSGLFWGIIQIKAQRTTTPDLGGTMGQPTNVNRKYKSSVFADYFNDGEKLIEAYNAIEGKNYPKDTEIRINTLTDVLFNGAVQRRVVSACG